MNPIMVEAALAQCKSDAERERTKSAMQMAYNAGRHDQKAEIKSAFRALGLATEDDL